VIWVIAVALYLILMAFTIWAISKRPKVESPGYSWIEHPDGSTEPVALFYAGYHNELHEWRGTGTYEPGDTLRITYLPPRTTIHIESTGTPPSWKDIK
jgi:hypothetical protein